MDKADDDIKVSICVVTYNQENYIQSCLKSLVEQDVSFRFEIVVGDDCSTDSTKKIVESFRENYPDLIVPVYHEENVGAVENTCAVYKKSRGLYICHMDGDDAALPDKLKEQVAVLDANSECVLCTHDALVIDKDGQVLRDSLKRKVEGIYDQNELLRDLPFFTNSTKMVRRQVCLESIKNLAKDAIDVEFHVLEASFGCIYHIDKSLGMYRQLVGVSSAQARVNPLVVAGYARLYEGLFFSKKMDMSKKELRKLYAKSMLNFSYQSLFFGCYEDARTYAKRSFSIRFYSVKQLALIFLSFSGRFAFCLVRLRGKFK
ncbi:MAG: glycosyltransferase [Marinobacter sp.]|uniref:glycosyltransferase n=1 Tax=Marinobacter sp. TaxID=50741 RepID=UPI001B6DB5F9|nr:glycosyltransferase [Marinobacter sp.]MBQ0746654.1 glycosyltransferase [Marinobacter sp.]MBQ0814217.1 glycosyltransferase [Marinobacter sp.]